MEGLGSLDGSLLCLNFVSESSSRSSNESILPDTLQRFYRAYQVVESLWCQISKIKRVNYLGSGFAYRASRKKQRPAAVRLTLDYGGQPSPEKRNWHRRLTEALLRDRPVHLSSPLGLSGFAHRPCRDRDGLSQRGFSPKIGCGFDGAGRTRHFIATVRNAPSVHGIGDHGFIPIVIRLAREKGVSAYLDEGNNR